MSKVEAMASEFHAKASNFLKNQWNAGEYLTRWLEKLEEVFKAAFAFKMDCLLDPRMIFYWPKEGNPLDLVTMATYTPENSGNTVQITLFPGLAIHGGLEEHEQRVVFRAFVVASDSQAR